MLTITDYVRKLSDPEATWTLTDKRDFFRKLSEIDSMSIEELEALDSETIDAIALVDAEIVDHAYAAL